MSDETAEPRPLIPEVASALSPLVRRIVADDAGPTTGPGTNTYLVGIDEIIVVDPGPDTDEHLDTVAGCGGDRIRWIVCTHEDPSHAAGAASLAKRTGAEVTVLSDGERISATEFNLTAVATPGHQDDHVCLLLDQERLLFSGDHLTVEPRPTATDADAWRRSCERLLGMRLRRIAPGHGQPIEQPRKAIEQALERGPESS